MHESLMILLKDLGAIEISDDEGSVPASSTPTTSGVPEEMRKVIMEALMHYQRCFDYTGWIGFILGQGTIVSIINPAIFPWEDLAPQMIDFWAENM